jgi:hypothetical protein
MGRPILPSAKEEEFIEWLSKFELEPTYETYNINSHMYTSGIAIKYEREKITIHLTQPFFMQYQYIGCGTVLANDEMIYTRLPIIDPMKVNTFEYCRDKIMDIMDHQQIFKDYLLDKVISSDYVKVDIAREICDYEFPLNLQHTF